MKFNCSNVMKLVVCVFFSIAASFSIDAKAQVVFDNGFPIVGSAGTDLLSDARAPLQAADDFMLSTAGSFSKVIWWGTVGPAGSPPGNFIVEIYMDDPGTPGQPAQFSMVSFDSTIHTTSRINTGLTNGAYPIYRYRMKIPPMSLPAGTPFWISVYKTGTAGTPWFYWMKSDLASTGNNF